MDYTTQYAELPANILGSLWDPFHFLRAGQAGSAVSCLESLPQAETQVQLSSQDLAWGTADPRGLAETWVGWKIDARA